MTRKKSRSVPQSERPRKNREQFDPGPVSSQSGPRAASVPPGLIARLVTRQQALCLLIFGLLIGLSYFPAVLGGFVWDDGIFTKAEAVRDWAGLWQIWFSPADIKNEGHYWPLVYTIFWLEHKLWGFAPAGYHVVNLLLHFINTLLLWRLLTRLAVPGAWVAAAVFAVHPVHVEAVAWIFGRKDLLATLFYLTATLTWLRFLAVSHPRARLGYYGLALVLFIAGLLSKSIVITLPLALLIGLWWKQGRVTLPDIYHLLPFFLIGFCITLADLAFYWSIESVSFSYSMVERVLIAARALWFYIEKLFWPTDLAIIYPHWQVSAADLLSWLPLIAAGATAILLWFYRHQIGRGPLAGLLFFVVTLSPLLGLVDYGYMQFSFVADRYQYLASIGVLAGFIGVVAHGTGGLPNALKRSLPGLVLIILVSLSALTWQQAGAYKDEVTFFRHIIDLNPKAHSAYSNLSKALIEAGRLEEAFTAGLVAINQAPDSHGAHYNTGLALSELERFQEAEQYFRSALKIKPKHTNTHQYLAEALKQQGRYEEALVSLRAVIARDSQRVEVYGSMGDILYRLNRYEEALDTLERARLLGPSQRDASALYHLIGLVSQELGRPEAIAERYRQALRVDSTDLSTHEHLAGLLHGQGQYEEALKAYTAIIDLAPENVSAYVNMGELLYRLKRYDEATKTLKQALSLESDPRRTPEIHYLIGLTMQAMGRLDAAAASYEQALEAEPNYPIALNALGALRLAQQRYREALTIFQTLVEIEPGNAKFYSGLGVTLYNLNRIDEALESFDQALALDPHLTEARTNREHLQQSIRQRD